MDGKTVVGEDFFHCFLNSEKLMQFALLFRYVNVASENFLTLEFHERLYRYETDFLDCSAS